MSQYPYTKLHVWSFGAALGIIYAVSLLVTGLTAMFFGLGVGFVETMRTIYLGYEATVLGSFIGAVWGFIDMFICGAILAALYNVFLRMLMKKQHK